MNFSFGIIKDGVSKIRIVTDGKRFKLQEADDILPCVLWWCDLGINSCLEFTVTYYDTLQQAEAAKAETEASCAAEYKLDRTEWRQVP